MALQYAVSLAVQAESTGVLRLLLENGADVNTQNAVTQGDMGDRVSVAKWRACPIHFPVHLTMQTQTINPYPSRYTISACSLVTRRYTMQHATQLRP